MKKFLWLLLPTMVGCCALTYTANAANTANAAHADSAYSVDATLPNNAPESPLPLGGGMNGAISELFINPDRNII